MKQKIAAILLVFAMVLTMAACSSGEETTLTGMVISVNGTVVSIMETDGTMGSWGDRNAEDGERPEMPEGITPPDGANIPEDGKMPNFGGMMGGFGSFMEDMETTDVDISGARISVEIDGGKAGGSVDNLQPGAFVTVTVNKKGEASYVLVSSSRGFGGRGFTK